MNDLEMQFFDNQDNDLESQFFGAASATKQPAKRGANFGGGVRSFLNGIPLVGEWTDEIEASIRAGSDGQKMESARKFLQSLSDEEKAYYRENPRELGRATTRAEDADYEAAYDMYAQNARDSVAGNLENTGYGLPLNIGTNILGDLGLAYLTGGATLIPSVSAAQGVLEGAGRGSGAGERVPNALAGGTVGAVVPAILNKILPTGAVQKQITNKLSKQSDNVLRKVFADSVKNGENPIENIARTVSKGERPAFLQQIRRDAVGNNAMRKPIYEVAVDNVNTPYTRYIGEAIEDAAPGYGAKIADNIGLRQLEELGDDILMNLDVRPIVTDAINTTMRGAPDAAREAVAGAAEKAIAERSVSKMLTKALTPKPINTNSGSIWSFLKRFYSPIDESINKGLVRQMTTGLEGQTSQIPFGLGRKLLSEPTRGGIDALLEGQMIRDVQ